MGLPMVGVGLLYQFGYFHQRTDPSGYQQEYWIESDPKRLPVVPVSGSDGRPLQVTVPVHDSSCRSRYGGPTSDGCRCTCSTRTSTRTRRWADG